MHVLAFSFCILALAFSFAILSFAFVVAAVVTLAAPLAFALVAIASFALAALAFASFALALVLRALRTVVVVAATTVASTTRSLIRQRPDLHRARARIRCMTCCGVPCPRAADEVHDRSPGGHIGRVTGELKLSADLLRGLVDQDLDLDRCLELFIT